MCATNSKGPQWHPATVSESIRETSKDTTLLLSAAHALDDKAFLPGNFIQLRDSSKKLESGRNMSAAYSLSGCPVTDDGHTTYRVTIRRTGERGMYFHDLAEGATIDVTKPAGKFVLDVSHDQRLYLLAGGSGVAPFRCFVEWLAQQQDAPKAVHIFHSAKDVDGLVFRREFMIWAGKHSWLHYHATCTGTSSAPLDDSIESGRWNQSRVAQHLDDPASAVVYACGPGGLVDSAMTWAKALGVPDAQRRREQW